MSIFSNIMLLFRNNFFEIVFVPCVHTCVLLRIKSLFRKKSNLGENSIFSKVGFCYWFLKVVKTTKAQVVLIWLKFSCQLCDSQ